MLKKVETQRVSLNVPSRTTAKLFCSPGTQPLHEEPWERAILSVYTLYYMLSLYLLWMSTGSGLVNCQGTDRPNLPVCKFF